MYIVWPLLFAINCLQSLFYTNISVQTFLIVVYFSFNSCVFNHFHPFLSTLNLLEDSRRLFFKSLKTSWRQRTIHSGWNSFIIFVWNCQRINEKSLYSEMLVGVHPYHVLCFSETCPWVFLSLNQPRSTHSRSWSCCFSTVLWATVMNEHRGTKYYTQKSFFEKFIWKLKCFCTQMKFAYSSVMCPFKLN